MFVEGLSANFVGDEETIDEYVERAYILAEQGGNRNWPILFSER